MIQKVISNEGCQVYWDAAVVRRDVVRQACEAAGGLGGLVPLFDVIACLKGVCDGICKAGITAVRGQPIEPRQLSRDVYGVTAVREVKGKVKNEYRHLFSVGCTGTNINDFQVKIWDVADGPETEKIRKNLAEFDTLARNLWDVEKDWMPAKQLTELCRKLVFHCGGVMLKKSGGLYFIPADHFPVFDQVVTAIEQSDTNAEFTSACIDTSASPRFIKQVLRGLDSEILAQTSQMRDEVADLANNSGKMRRNGIERRLKDLREWQAKVEYYENLFSTALPTLRTAINDAQYAVGVHGLEALGATE